MLIPTPNGGTRLFQPGWPVTPEVREAIRRAVAITLTQRDRAPEHARKAAILNSQAIAEDSEAAQDER